MNKLHTHTHTHRYYKQETERNCYKNFVKNVNEYKKIDINLVKGDQFL